MMKKIKVGIYIRVSTQEQAESGYSIHEQEERLTKYADVHNWSIYKVYSDPGFSGAKIDRPALSEMVQDIKRGKIQKVLVYKLDRLSRRQRDTLYLIEDIFIPNNVDFVSMTEQIDTGSPLGRAMIGILATFAQLEREQIKERMQVGLDARAKEGYYHAGGFDPIGYNYVDGELIINEYEAMQIRHIYDLYVSGMGFASIVTWLDKKGYTKRYGEWTESSTRSVLFTPLYKGVIVWKGKEYPGRHTAIFTEEEYALAQKVKTQRVVNDPNLSATPFKRTSLLGGLIYCGNCGARYYVKQNTVKRYPGTDPNKKPLKYYCCYSRGKGRKSMIKDPTCKNPNYNVETLNLVILEEIKKLSIDKKYLAEILRDKVVDDPKQNILTLQNRISEIDKQITKMVDLYQIGAIDFNLINEKIEKLNEEKKALEDDIYNEDVITPDLSVEEAKNIIATIPEILENGTEEDIKDVVHSLINSIIIYDDVLEIHWKFI